MFAVQYMMMFVLCTAFLMIYGEVQDGAMEDAHGILHNIFVEFSRFSQIYHMKTVFKKE